ncbi:ATP phosphoribosyltransferase regulatory subunit [Altererythrobacter epoxidivorans]|uniref:ATP phosphoribosyltransferase regulatory subunit n=1 Tax=Altererythrobacter epoxidivorans TaxID=361183 RepID=A0A0M4M8R4_9SPHN|nr:ATP phosphoribosyltransferase regulatory subunit [Altererythrobacter epoxidivorans]ALE17098.1 ATP phosphoribosyltransferase regulatory subunit [Altererythrobacter epoxidivorans]
MTEPDDLLPEGLEDRLPREAATITRAMRACLDVLGSHGYDRVRPPIVEFEKSLAGRMDGVQPRRMFRFVDPVSLRTLALRSDITPQIGRIAATIMANAPRPLRLAYSGETALIKADQLDPARERIQLGAELVGSDSVEAVCEVVSIAVEALHAAGLKGVSVDFTLPDLVDTLSDKALPLAGDARDAVRRELDMKDAGGLKAAGGEAYLPLLYAAGPFDEALAKLKDIDAGGALASRIEGLKAVAARIDGKARITLDPTERHGFEYQSWIGFTLYAEGVRGAVGRGGTYRIRGSEEAATGFSIFVESLASGDIDQPAEDCLYLPLGHDRDAASRLRAIGWRTRAQIGEGEDARALGCTHRLDGKEPVAL